MHVFKLKICNGLTIAEMRLKISFHFNHECNVFGLGTLTEAELHGANIYLKASMEIKLTTKCMW